MQKRLLNTIYLENSELYATVNGQRIRLANCTSRIEIYEHSTKVNSIGMQGYNVKKRHVKIALCGEFDFTREVNADYLQTVSAFELLCDIQRHDGIFERKYIDGLVPIEIDLDGEWQFDIANYPEWIKNDI